ncbi:MAG: hypothetical protein MZV70_42820 [Desulfobacterales bacterium]|nr:hypothetical protein [Desulfobacterales bacterium]
MGLTSQYVEQIGARLVGSLFGAQAARRPARRRGQPGRQLGFSFATTYALGQRRRCATTPAAARSRLRC